MQTHQTPTLLLVAVAGGVLALAGARWLWPAEVAAQSADSGSRYVAVAAEYQTGVSLLYVLDQTTQHLVVYQARGGAPNSHEVTLVGARNISLDTQLEGYNDESDYSYQDLVEMFARRKIPPPAVDENPDRK
ncbi:MAG TPA: hypothetical protein VGC54_10385 [Planctomycetota bacterium]